jgi:molecular chaperone HtpG
VGSPYRTVPTDEAAEAPRDAGIVGDVIAQFADPLAFYRELVQNAIDADSEAVDVELVHDTRVMIVRVRDRGCGMTRDILENQLLVLFRSTKEKDGSKIGKFGIGFASVLAPNPNVVVVQTSRDGRRLVLHLSRDLTYKIFDGGPATQTGTTVELELAIPTEEAQQFSHRSHDSLVRWCRHATVPISLHVDVPGLKHEVRIDRPLALENAVVEVRATSQDKQLTAIVGIARDAKPYAGFFNHGLMLFETTEPLVGKLAFKIQDARLGHTLSRDNVRRDQHFARALGTVRTIAEGELSRAIERALRDGISEPGRWEALAQAVVDSEIGLADAQWTLPSIANEPIAGGSIGGTLWSSDRPTALATAVAAKQPVVRIPEYARPLWSRLARLLDTRIVDVASELTLVIPVEESAEDRVLTDALLEVFEACHRGPPRVVIANLDGAHENLLAIAGGGEDAAFPATDGYVLATDVATSTPFTRTRRRPVVLNAKHMLVRRARQAADPRLAATHLARGVLLQHRILDVDKSAAILRYTLRITGDA